MRIAMIGQKGIPATHGGVERHVEELASRLVARGHEVTVFTRPAYTDPTIAEHLGIKLVSVPSIATKHLDAIVHSALCSVACWRGGYDLVHYHAIGPCLAAPIARLRGLRVVATIHGQDWKREKWGWAAKRILRAAEWMALHVPDVTISVSKTLADHYASESDVCVEYVPNGIRITTEDDTTILSDLGVSDSQYVLFAGRLVPEKGVHYLLAAHKDADTSLRLVVAGDTSHSDSYVDELLSIAGPRVIFSGYQYGARLASLFRHAALFVLPSDLEGLPLVLLEALAYGVPVLASDIAPNVEVMGELGEYFSAGSADDLRRALEDVLKRRGALREAVAAQRPRLIAEYDWDKIAERTEELYAVAIDR